MYNVHSSGKSRNHQARGEGKTEHECCQHFLQYSLHIAEFSPSHNESNYQEQNTQTHGNVRRDVMIEVPGGISVTVCQKWESIISRESTT
jgi:hypothetical protein